MYCSVSRVWSPTTDQNYKFAHCGSRVLSQILARKKFPVSMILLSVFVVLYFGIWALLEFQPLDPEAQNYLQYSLWSLCGLGIFVIAIPILLRNPRLFHSDTWIALFLGASVLSLPSFLEMGFILTFGLVWILLRLGEAHLWRKKLSKSFESFEKDWSRIPSAFSDRIHQYIGFTGLAFILGAYAFNVWSSQNWMPDARLALVMAIFTTPFFSYLVTKLLKRAEEMGWLCSDFSFFRNLRKSKLAFFHSTGVLSTGDLAVSETWIEDSTEWPQEDVREILVHLSHQSSHPISEAIRAHFPRVKKPLLELEKLEVQPHLGVTGIFRDVQRSKVTARLGSFSWHRVLQSEMNDKGRENLKKWLDAGLHVCLLSLNETIVCGLAFEDEWNDCKDFNEQLKRERILISSTLRSSPESLQFNATHYDSFPSERKNWSMHWMERVPQTIEVAAWWDQPSDPQMPRIHFQRLDRPTTDTHKLVVYSRNLAALASVVRNSESFQRHCAIWVALSPILGVTAILLLPSIWVLAPSVLAIHCSTFVWTYKFALQ